MTRHLEYGELALVQVEFIGNGVQLWRWYGGWLSITKRQPHSDEVYLCRVEHLGIEVGQVLLGCYAIRFDHFFELPLDIGNLQKGRRSNHGHSMQVAAPTYIEHVL